MQKFLLFIVVVVLQFSCKKDTVLPEPKADFSVAGTSGGFIITYTDTVFVIGTHDALGFMNKSVNADSITWDFGNGKTSSEANVLLSYDNPGIYDVTLTAINRKGVRTSSIKKVTVMERVVKSFSINNVQLNKFSPSQNGLPVFTKLDIWAEIKFSQSWDDTQTTNGDIQAPVIYRSPVFPDIDSSFHSSLVYQVPASDKVVINTPVNNYEFTSKGFGTVFNLYGRDNSGTYLLASSRWSGIGLAVLNGVNPASSKNFGLKFGVAGSETNVVFDCVYQ